MFNRLVLNHANCKVNFYDEYNVIILCNSLPQFLKNVKNTIKYGRDKLSIDIVVNALRVKDLELKTDNNKSKGLSIVGKYNGKNFVSNIRKSYYSKKQGYYIKNFLKKNEKERGACSS